MCPDSAGFISPYFYFINQINPIASISGGSAITCEEPILTLTAQSNIGNIAWLNDLGKIIGTGPQLSLADAGFYTLKITDGTCTDTETKWVKNNKQIPTVKATGGQIDPGTGSIQLHANSIYTGLIYHWSGPNGFTSSLKNPVVSIPGLYMLTVTNPVTGCSNSVEVIVTI